MKVREEKDNNIEKQMGCMAGFFHIFDRHQVLAGKRIYSTRRLPSSPSTSSPSPSERSDASPPPSAKESSPSPTTPKKMSPAASTNAEAATTPRPPLPLQPLQVFEFKEGSKAMWKLREAPPRLSLDSRLREEKGKLYPRDIRTTPVPMRSDGSEIAADDHDRQRRSPSVVARLMGLELLPGNDGAQEVSAADVLPFRKPPVLRRSASESRASRDFPPPFALIPADNKTPPPPAKPNAKQSTKTPSATRQVPQATVPPIQRKSFFDAQDFFPEPSKRVPSAKAVASNGGGIDGGGSLYGEIEKRLRLRGIDEPAKDLETLKQILEALQLKGLLHAGRREDRQYSIVKDGRPDSSATQSPIVLMKPATRRSTRFAAPTASRLGASPTRKNLIPDQKPRAARSAAEKKPHAAEARSPSSSLARRRGANIDRKTSTVPSPRSAAHSPRRVSSSERSTVRSPRSRNTAAASPCQIEISDESSTVSESSCYSTTSQFDLERVKMEEYQQGRSLLERCGKLLHSIEEITTVTSVGPAEMNQQPSPVSVLDFAAASFCCDGAGSPSPSVAAAPRKRCIDFNDQELERGSVDPCSSSLVPPPPAAIHMSLRPSDGDDSDAGDGDFEYVVEVLRLLDSDRAGAAAAAVAESSLDDYFFSLEKRYQRSGAAADISNNNKQLPRLHRRLVFDTVVEIVERNKRVSPWESFVASSSLSPIVSLEEEEEEFTSRLGRQRAVWAEVRRIRPQKVPAEEDLCDIVCGVLQKDIVAVAGCRNGEERGWSSRHVEISDAVLDIERLIFKDLVAEAIKDLASSPLLLLLPLSLLPSRKCRAGSAAPPRRKLVF